jgi:hypothetical protein
MRLEKAVEWAGCGDLFAGYRNPHASCEIRAQPVAGKADSAPGRQAASARMSNPDATA